MAGLDPAIQLLGKHSERVMSGIALLGRRGGGTLGWMAGSSPAMTVEGASDGGVQSVSLSDALREALAA